MWNERGGGGDVRPLASVWLDNPTAAIMVKVLDDTRKKRDRDDFLTQRGKVTNDDKITMGAVDTLPLLV